MSYLCQCDRPIIIYWCLKVVALAVSKPRPHYRCLQRASHQIAHLHHFARCTAENESFKHDIVLDVLNGARHCGWD